MKGATTGYSLPGKTEGSLQKKVQHSLNVYYSVYTSLHVSIQPDKGKSVGKLLQHFMSIFIKEGVGREKKCSMSRGFVHV